MTYPLMVLCLACALLTSCGSTEETNSTRTNPCDAASNPECDSDSAADDTATSTADSSAAEPNDSNSEPETNEDIVRILPFSCFIGPSPCDPRNGDGCAAGETCDFAGEGELGCFPPPNTAGIDEPCDNSAGPYCAAGGWCAPDTITGESFCQQVCCVDSECTHSEFECVSIFTDPNIGSLGLCKFPSEDSGDDDAPEDCLPPGASCSPANDQCCGYCHAGHCH
mgnify:CR=1 FL=1